ncbi:hypothetical protein CCR97_18410 [Rhodoplanes elegans]|uniref:Glycosyl transferase family 1 domain-containing protein n=1 Tax=Rhodoplanes elegans TaxID=29408 RepID=A0A327KVM4_9BRAD|nr:glycosyltransferase family 4 protein [Rhodoplanes elegans]MBK5960163.1 hypothetical protein [Rhodoplanes elegans]RAI42257.1 hypothetical protein CH338_00440 [Rhodoplanes elegans]
MKRIRCVHQGYELYGSDRTFISCVTFLRDRYPDWNVEVVLPKEGPLSDVLRNSGFKIIIRDLWVLRKGYGYFRLALRGLLLPIFVYRSLHALKDHDFLYINTCVIVDHMLAACFHRRSVIHVHEIPGRATRWLIRFLIAMPRVKVLFNSHATRNSIQLPKAIPQTVVHNGVEIAALEDRGLPHTGSAGDAPIRLLLIGRINSWKGQDLLIEALALLPEAARKQFRVRIVGDAFEGAPFRNALLAHIASRQLADLVEVLGFQNDPSVSYYWSDVVVVPSRMPEPFGLVAIEAMAHGRPVVAAAHGGLVEIVENERTGFLHQPNDAADLARVLKKVIFRRGSLSDLGEAGRARYASFFTIDAFKASFLEAVASEFQGMSVST